MLLLFLRLQENKFQRLRTSSPPPLPPLPPRPRPPPPPDCCNRLDSQIGGHQCRQKEAAVAKGESTSLRLRKLANISTAPRGHWIQLVGSSAKDTFDFLMGFPLAGYIIHSHPCSSLRPTVDHYVTYWKQSTCPRSIGHWESTQWRFSIAISSPISNNGSFKSRDVSINQWLNQRF